MTQQKTIIFDFDGTIADTFALAVDIFYALTKRLPLPKEEVDRLRGLALLKVAEELKIPPWRVPILLIRGRKLMARRMATVELVPGMDKLIKRLYDEGYQLYILSSNSSQNIRLFLKRYGLEECFTHVEGGINLFAKTRSLRRLVAQHKMNPLDVLYIGDEARDIEAAHRAKVRCVAVAWGYNNIHVLNKHAPFALVFDPSEIVGVKI